MSGDNISIELDPHFVRETLTTGQSDKFRGKCKMLYGIVNLRPDTFTSMVEKNKDSFSVSNLSQDGVYCKIVGVDIQAKGSGY